MVNHIPWSYSQFRSRNVSTLQNHPSLDTLREWGIDAVEAIGGNVLDLKSYKYARKHGLIVATGSDMHKPGPAFGWTIAAPASFTNADVWTEIVNKRTSFLYDPEGLRLFMPPESLAVTSEILASVYAFVDFIGTFIISENGQVCGTYTVGLPGLILPPESRYRIPECLLCCAVLSFCAGELYLLA
jgi:hypothetical protein